MTLAIFGQTVQDEKYMIRTFLMEAMNHPTLNIFFAVRWDANQLPNQSKNPAANTSRSSVSLPAEDPKTTERRRTQKAGVWKASVRCAM